MKILPVSDFEEAARLAVKISKIVEIAKDAQVDLSFGSKEKNDGLITIWISYIGILKQRHNELTSWLLYHAEYNLNNN